MGSPDAIVVGSGPNGLAAAITLAKAGLSVLVLEAQLSIGGGTRSGELTLPGFTHDLCSAIHPFAHVSPFFRQLPLEKFGLEWIHSPAAFGHPLSDGSVILAERSLEQMRDVIGGDYQAYARLLGPARNIAQAVGSEKYLAAALPHLPSAMPTGIAALGALETLARRSFGKERTRALLAGAAAHSMLRLDKAGTAGIAIALLAATHAVGWPFPRGGAQKIADAMAAYLQSLGGRIEIGRRVRDIRDLPPCRAILLDVTPRQVLEMAGPLLPERYKRLLRHFRHGIGAYKMDWALSDPVPWRSPELRRAVGLHIGGTLAEIAEAERAPWDGKVSDRPFIIAAQQSLFDSTRAPQGKHTLWAYCHVPFGCDVDMTSRMEAQIERFAPGFRDCILARNSMPPRALEAHNPNLIGGDITGGMQDIFQTLMRPTFSYWKTPLRNLYLCSSSTPPGVGVHAMCGYLAARTALRRAFGISRAFKLDH